MADTHTPSLRLRLLEVGANEDTWGDELNANVISMIEEAVAGIVSVSVTAGNVTLSTANGTTDQARNALIKFTGTPGATRTVTLPDVEKLTWVINAVGDSSSITCTAGAGTSVSIPAGSCALVYTDGATNAAAVPVAYLTNGKLGIGMTPSNILDITQTQNAGSIVQLQNASAGTSAFSTYQMFNGTAAVGFRLNGSGFTTAGLDRQNGAKIETNGAGGLTLNTGANQPIYFGVNSVEVARLNTTPALELTCGQIKFPATQVSSADANTLDDYEEGTFTPTLGDGTNNYTLSIGEGSYTKISNQVIWHALLIWTSIGSAGASQLRIGGLPFAAFSGNITYSATIGTFAGLDTTATLNQITLQLSGGASAPHFYRSNDNAAATNLAANSSSATGSIQASGCYRV
jgi:hypothetical protein